MKRKCTCAAGPYDYGHRRKWINTLAAEYEAERLIRLARQGNG